MAKQKAKKHHIANSDTDSENSYPASQPTYSSLSTSTKKPYVPRFLIIHSEKGETISSLSPFVAGEPKSIKNLRSGDLLMHIKRVTRKKSTTDEDILWSKMLRNTPFILEHIERYYLLSSLEQSDKR